MKKILSLLMITGILMTTGCQKVSDLLVPQENEGESTETQEVKPTATPSPEVDPQTKIPISQMLMMTNEWELIGDYDFEITKKGKKDRIVLGTSAEAKNGEFMWDDSQYWTVAVISEDGAYNLFSERIQGRVYMEVNEGFIKGVVTPVITVYIFSGNDREIRNYTFDGEYFIESQEYTTKNFSTGGINNRYTSIQEYKPL